MSSFVAYLMNLSRTLHLMRFIIHSNDTSIFNYAESLIFAAPLKSQDLKLNLLEPNLIINMHDIW